MPRRSNRSAASAVRTRMTTRGAVKIAFPNMPQEIIDIIITFTQPDLETAKACSLVGRVWRNTSQKIVLSRICVDNDTSERFCSLLSNENNEKTSSSFRNYVLHLDFDISWSKNRYIVMDDHASAENARSIFQGLPRLESISLHGFSGCSDPRLLSVTSAILDLLKRHKLRNLEIRETTIPELTPFLESLHGSGLMRLDIRDAGFHTMGNSSLDSQDSLSTEAHLTELTLGDISGNAVPEILTTPLLCLTGLRILRLYRPDDVFPSYLPVLASILANAPLLVELSLDIEEFVLLPEIHAIPTLNQCHDLEKLTIRVVGYNPERHDSAMKGLLLAAELIRSVQSAAPLPSVSLLIDCGIYIEEGASWLSKWTDIEDALLPVGYDDPASQTPLRSLDLLCLDDDIQEAKPSILLASMPRLSQLGLLRLKSFFEMEDFGPPLFPVTLWERLTGVKFP